ncbi:MAG TPA: hypothetical protein VLJ59_11305 [Mycobacteriales bacterium]|nr:hypothetical protein [Mycobacteriales bacterium]
MRKFAAAAALFAVALGGYPPPVASASSNAAQPRPPVRRPPARAVALARESLAAVHAAGSGRATVTETGPGERATATSWFRLAGGPAGIVVRPQAEPADIAEDPDGYARLRRCLDPRGAAALFTVASAVRRMGPARVGGQVTVRYRLSVDLDVLPRTSPETVDDIAALRRAGLTHITVDVWLDQAKRPARVSLSAVAGGEPVETVDCRYYDWGSPPAEPPR